MNTFQSTPIEAQSVLAAAVAHQIERMSKEEVQALVNRAPIELEKEIAALKERVVALEAKAAEREEYIRMLCRYIGKLELDPEELERTFDPSEYTIPIEQTFAEIEKLLEGYPGDAKRASIAS